MTRAEFHKWIEEKNSEGRTHYEELLAVARRRSNSDAEDILHNAIAGMLDSDGLARVERAGNPDTRIMAIWPWAVSWVRGHASVARRGVGRAETALGRAGSFLEGEVEAAADPRAFFVGPFCWRQLSRKDQKDLPLRRLAGRYRSNTADKDELPALGPWRQQHKQVYRIPRLRPPAPHEPFGEYSVQSGAPCRKCGIATTRYVNEGRDFDKVYGRIRYRFEVTRCLNGHEYPDDTPLTEVRR